MLNLILKQKYFGAIVFLGAIFLLPNNASALTNITSTGIAGGGFPVALTTAGETYQLTEDIICDTTCLTVKANNVTLDLNGKNATFGIINNPDLQNSGMENWMDANTLINWTVLGGTVTQRSAQVWGNYDAELSATASLKSDNVILNIGQTYNYYAMMYGSSSDSYVISLRDANNGGAILSSTTINGGLLNRAFAMADGSIGAVENSFKPTVSTTAYLQIDAIGTSVKRLHVADIKPSHHYFLTSNNYRNLGLYPDLADALFSSVISGLTIHNSQYPQGGIISQGAGKAVKSAAIYSTGLANIHDVSIDLSGNNTSAIIGPIANYLIDNVSMNTTSFLEFNRMHPTPMIDVFSSATGNATISNSTFYNFPCQGLRNSNSFLLDTDTAALNIDHNKFYGKEQVTEGYAIVLGGGNNNVTIDANTIEPIKGRGILLDAVANRSGYLDGSKNVTIKNNTLNNIYEQITPEYGATSLEAAGIRVRDWGSLDPVEGHRNLSIHDNSINGYINAAGTHRTYGINMTSQSAVTSADIYNNTINISLDSQLTSDWQASAIALQGADMSLGGLIKVRNNELTGSHALRIGGNDGSQVKSIQIYENKINGSLASIFFHGYLGPFADNSFYCNKINNISTTGYPIYFDDGVPTVTNQWFSNNQITNANAGGFELFLNKNYSTNVTACNNGVMDIFGGGSIGSAGLPCHDGVDGCYALAGKIITDFTAPIAPSGLNIL